MAAARSLGFLRSYIGAFAWAPFVQLSKGAVLGLLQKIEYGQLEVLDEDGKSTTCGSVPASDDAPTTQLKVLKDVFWVRVLLFADMVR